MTRDEAAQELANLRDRLIWCDDNKDETRRAKSALNAGIEAIVGKQPDTETGLMPCGCGGWPDVISPDISIVLYLVQCDRCHMETDCYDTKQETIDAWNKAVGG